jgi:hypothetical protein
MTTNPLPRDLLCFAAGLGGDFLHLGQRGRPPDRLSMSAPSSSASPRPSPVLSGAQTPLIAAFMEPLNLVLGALDSEVGHSRGSPCEKDMYDGGTGRAHRCIRRGFGSKKPRARTPPIPTESLWPVLQTVEREEGQGRGTCTCRTERSDGA